MNGRKQSRFANGVGEVVLRGELAEGGGGGCESVRHAHAGLGEVANEFAEGGVFPADEGRVRKRNGGQGEDEGGLEFGMAGEFYTVFL